ncbi:unnamed protein product [Rhizoctonia solani]|uniref:Uncharacterized protein n=1 Tax=Rhizoctonia solani TaxID=456999 RepID=A0A8H3GAM5_9AGAM|nr:unnamed protein product [Rhizoctonia solani]
MSSQSSQSSSSPPHTPRSRIKYINKKVRKANQALGLIAEIELEDPDDEGVKEAAKQLGQSLTKTRQNLKDVQPNVDTLRGKKPSENAETLCALGNPAFLEKVREMYTRPSFSVQDWFCYALDKTKANASEDASLGFYLMARGMVVDDELEESLVDMLGSDIEDQLMQSLDPTRIAELHYDGIWDIYQSLSPQNPRNKRHRTELLQHIVQCIEHIRFCMAWLRLAGSDDTTARARSIRKTYAVKCARDTPPTEPDYSSNDFQTFHGQFKNFRTGAKRIYDAYEVFGSILLICPLMHISAFHDSRTGVVINDFVKALGAIENLPTAEFEDREQLHNSVLKGVVTVLEGLHGREDLSAMLDDMEAAYFN